MIDPSLPSREELLKGCEQYRIHEKRDAMYKVATFLICHFWGNTTEVTNGLGVLLLTWNQAHFRYGSFSFENLEACLRRNLQIINTFRSRDRLSLSDEDESAIKGLFDQFLDAVKVVDGTHIGWRTPVGVAKALHLLAPDFFPIWDEKIAKNYNCNYSSEPAKKYFLFCKKIREVARVIQGYIEPSKKPLIKSIDEYNYSKYTKHWI